MARTLTTAQADALAALDRQSHVKVEVEDGDGSMVDVTDFLDEDWLDAVSVEASNDEPVSAATIRLRRDIVDIDGTLLSLSPLMENSRANQDSGGSYAPVVDLSRKVDVYVDVTEPGHSPSWQLLWEGFIDEPEFGRRESQITLSARDPMGRLVDTFIETVATYGGGSPLEAIEDVMQAILNAEMGSGTYPLTVVGDPDFGIEEYELGNVSVLDALIALRDLIGWNLHWKWDESISPPDFSLTLYEPTRDAADLSGYTPDHTLGADDYFEIPELRLTSAGIRNAGEVLYTDSAGDEQTATETRSTSVALHGRRFIRLDMRGSSIVTETQAENLLSAVLDDLAGPFTHKVIDCPFLWDVELGDTVRFTANGVHFDTDQDLAVVAYRHELSPERRRTILTVAGKPSGGYRRWLQREVKGYRRARHRIAPEQFGSTNGPLQPSGTGSPEEFFATLDLPIGSIITAIRSRAARRNAGDTVEVALFGKWQYLGSPPISVLLNALLSPDITHGVDANDWTVERAAIASVTVTSTGPDRVGVTLEAASAVTDAQLAWVEVEYLDPLPGPAQ